MGTLLLILRLALIIALYAFLGWALWTLWQDLRSQGKTLSTFHAPVLILRMHEDSDDHTFRFTSSEVLVGRDLSCECHIDDITISARHARLAFHHGQWWVEDLNSRNGTFLNDAPVTASVVITSGDRLQCGQRFLSISIGESVVSTD